MNPFPPASGSQSFSAKPMAVPNGQQTYQTKPLFQAPAQIQTGGGTDNYSQNPGQPTLSPTGPPQTGGPDPYPQPAAPPPTGGGEDAYGQSLGNFSTQPMRLDGGSGRVGRFSVVNGRPAIGGVPLGNPSAFQHPTITSPGGGAGSGGGGFGIPKAGGGGGGPALNPQPQSLGGQGGPPSTNYGSLAPSTQAFMHAPGSAGLATANAAEAASNAAFANAGISDPWGYALGESPAGTGTSTSTGTGWQAGPSDLVSGMYPQLYGQNPQSGGGIFGAGGGQQISNPWGPMPMGGMDNQQSGGKPDSAFSIGYQPQGQQTNLQSMIGGLGGGYPSMPMGGMDGRIQDREQRYRQGGGAGAAIDNYRSSLPMGGADYQSGGGGRRNSIIDALMRQYGNRRN